jgi:hypothetical protein
MVQTENPKRGEIEKARWKIRVGNFSPLLIIIAVFLKLVLFAFQNSPGTISEKTAKIFVRREFFLKR